MANFRSRYHEKDKTLIIIYSSENKLVSFRFVSSTRSADSTIFHILLVTLSVAGKLFSYSAWLVPIACFSVRSS